MVVVVHLIPKSRGFCFWLRFFLFFFMSACYPQQLPSNCHHLPTNRHSLPTNRQRLPTNRHRLHTNRHRRAYWTLRLFFPVTAPPGEKKAVKNCKKICSSSMPFATTKLAKTCPKQIISRPPSHLNTCAWCCPYLGGPPQRVLCPIVPLASLLENFPCGQWLVHHCSAMSTCLRTQIDTCRRMAFSTLAVVGKKKGAVQQECNFMWETHLRLDASCASDWPPSSLFQKNRFEGYRAYGALHLGSPKSALHPFALNMCGRSKALEIRCEGSEPLGPGQRSFVVAMTASGLSEAPVPLAGVERWHGPRVGRTQTRDAEVHLVFISSRGGGWGAGAAWRR